MNNDLLRKMMLYMNKRSISVVYPLAKTDLGCLIPVLDKYGNRLHTLSIGRIVELLNRAIELEKYGLALEYLDRISVDRMIRVLFRLAERVAPERLRPLFGELKNIEIQEFKDFNERYATIMYHIESIVNNGNKYKHPH